MVWMRTNWNRAEGTGVLSAVLIALSACGASGQEPAGAYHPTCPDPAIVRADSGTGYYVFGTGRGIPIWFSTDLHQWTPAGRVFPAGLPDWARQAIPGARGIWAPDVSFFAGKYRVYYAVSTFGSQRSAIGMAESPTLDPRRADYGWTDRGMVAESHPGRDNFNAIDPALFVDADGTPYLFLGSYWKGLFATPVDPDSGKPTASPLEWTRVAGRAPGVDPPAIEAPYVIRRDGYYYLFVSWDFCCAGVDSTYKVMVGRSTSVLGPYVDAEGKPMVDGHATLVLESSTRWRGPGHNSLIHTDQGDWLVHACYDAELPRGRERVLNVRPLTWTDGWPTAGEALDEAPAP